MHYFGSLERFAIDRANTIVFPTRPDLNDQQTTQDRVWNTIVRGDHQLSPNHTYNVRWLREQSPQIEPDRADRRPSFPTGRAAREESDVDQSLAVNLNSVLSNTKVNTLRVTWTRENVTFANACYNGNGRDLGPCEPTLAYQNFTDQQDNTGQFRINDGIAVRRHAGLVPARQARRPRHQGRRAVRLLGRAEREPGQPERHVRVRPERPRLRPGQPAHLPGSLHASASAGRASSTRRRPTSRRSCRTSGG